MKYLNLLFILFLTNISHAEVNKCIDSKGKITFTDKVCSHEQKASTVKINPTNIIDSSAGRHAIQQLKQQEYQQKQSNYYKSLKYSADRQRANNYDDEVKRKNAQRMFSIDRPCHYESGLVRCY